MKEQLIELSKQKGFLSRDRLITVNKGYYYLWLCELQKWLREKHNIEVLVRPVVIGVYSFKIFDISGNIIIVESLHPPKHRYKIYEQALEIGLFEALRLIK